MVNPAPGYYFTFVKRLHNWSEVARFRTKTLNFTRFIRINLSAKIKLKGPWSPDRQIVVNFCFTRVLLYAKILRETEETIGFCVTFLSLVAFPGV